MTTEQIRKNIKVVHYGMADEGFFIVYWKWNKEKEHWDEYRYAKNGLEAVEELISSGIFDIDDRNSIMDYFTGLDTWQTYFLSQWDALTLVIRYEYAKSLESDTNMLEIDKALEALKNI